MRRFLLLLCLATPLAADPVFEEKRGLVVMEAESTDSSLGRWKLKTFLKGYEGTGHLEFTGNKPENGPPASPLRYKFRINKPGKYSLVLRAHKRLETKRTDISNDCYVAMKGDFTAGGSAPMKILKDDTKLFGGHAETWGWATTLDANHKKFPAEYIFNAGETYQLTISGGKPLRLMAKIA